MTKSSKKRSNFMRGQSLSIPSAGLLVVSLVITVMTSGAWAQSNYKSLYKFTGGQDGGDPQAGLISDQAGNLYGTTVEGGVNKHGTVFKLAPNSDGSWTESVLYSFCALGQCDDGAEPVAGLIFDQTGSLYGTTLGGDLYSSGTVFKLTPTEGGSWTETVLWSFTGRRDGGDPYCGLTFDLSGNLYGTTSNGGVYGRGTVFKLTPHSGANWTESVLYDFTTGGSNSGIPLAGVIFDAAGNLYGTTENGGEDNEGTVFELKPTKKGIWTISVLHSFTGGRDGGGPGYGNLVMDAAGNLYGTTVYGGIYEYGAVFKLAQSSGKWRETVIQSFTGRGDGATPVAGLTFDSTGNLYGTTQQGGDLGRCGGDGCGTVFKLVPNSNGGWNETVLHDFFDHPGDSPAGGVTFGAAGNLYGTTDGDGTTSEGSVFEVTP
jgi:uncharacterized repeat protein (TIGR03803 family)